MPCKGNPINNGLSDNWILPAGRQARLRGDDIFLMKKIGIDARLISKTGVGVYIRNLLYYLEKKVLDNYLFYIYLLKEDFAKIKFNNKNFIKIEADYRWHTLSEQINFGKKLYQDKLDLMHFTYFTYPLIYKKNYVATIHDMTPIYFKTGKASTKNRLVYEFKHFLFKIVLSSEIKNAKAIITPCASVKEQLINYYGEKYRDKIHPIYEGVNYQLTDIKENQSLKNNFSNDFFIYVGNFYPHKNVERLIQAFSQITNDVQLILLGPNDFFTKRITELIKEIKQEKRVILYNNLLSNNVRLEDLVFFYKHARALINPSLSEGFGLPLLEASYFDCPVIASNIKVFNEIMSDKYVKFDPYDIEDITNKINKFLQTKPQFDLKKEMHKYSFNQMADETLKLYEVNLHI